MRFPIVTAAAAALALSSGAAATVAARAQDMDPATVAAAETEGQVRVYSALDSALAAELVKDFQTAYPKIRVDYVDQSTTEIYNRAISESAAGQGSADVLLSSAMDLQYKLMKDGMIEDVALGNEAALAPWSHAAGGVYGFTKEPLVIVYNKRLMPEGDVPHNRAELTALLNEKPEYKGKVATIDPERIGTGFLFFTQDAIHYDKFWDLAMALGKSEVKLYTSTGAMLEKVTSGEHLMAYNIIGSYAAERAKKDPSVGVIYPDDYVIAISRVGMVPKTAVNKNAGKVFMSYLLSQRGQDILKARSFGTVLNGATQTTVVPAEQEGLIKAVAVDDELLQYLNPVTRLKFIKSWQQAIRGN